MKKIKYKRVLAIAAWLGALCLLLFSCSDDLDIKQAYGFSLETMPVQKRISPGETAEIRCTLVREGEYVEAKYFIRYFQPDGKGELALDDGTIFLPNDLYPLDREMFRLYYTSHSTDRQVIDVYIVDSFGQVEQVSFSFQYENADD